MTRSTPLRRMILQFSQIFLMDDLTFIAHTFLPDLSAREPLLIHAIRPDQHPRVRESLGSAGRSQ